MMKLMEKVPFGYLIVPAALLLVLQACAEVEPETNDQRSAPVTANPNEPLVIFLSSQEAGFNFMGGCVVEPAQLKPYKSQFGDAYEVPAQNLATLCNEDSSASVGSFLTSKNQESIKIIPQQHNFSLASMGMNWCKFAPSDEDCEQKGKTYQKSKCAIGGASKKKNKGQEGEGSPIDGAWCKAMPTADGCQEDKSSKKHKDKDNDSSDMCPEDGHNEGEGDHQDDNEKKHYFLGGNKKDHSGGKGSGIFCQMFGIMCGDKDKSKDKTCHDPDDGEDEGEDEDEDEDASEDDNNTPSKGEDDSQDDSQDDSKEPTNK